MTHLANTATMEPVVDEVSQTYWDALSEHRLLLQRNPTTGEVQWPARGRCIPDWDIAPEWIEASGRGTVYSFSTVYKSSHGYPDTPYTLVIVALEEGGYFTSRLVDVDPDQVRIGLEVTLAFEGRHQTLPVFTVARKG